MYCFYIKITLIIPYQQYPHIWLHWDRVDDVLWAYQWHLSRSNLTIDCGKNSETDSGRSCHFWINHYHSTIPSNKNDASDLKSENITKTKCEERRTRRMKKNDIKKDGWDKVNEGEDTNRKREESATEKREIGEQNRKRDVRKRVREIREQER